MYKRQILNLPAEKIGIEMYELLTMANQTTEDVCSWLDNLLKWTKSQIGKLNVVYQDVDLVEVTDGYVHLDISTIPFPCDVVKFHLGLMYFYYNPTHFQSFPDILL